MGKGECVPRWSEKKWKGGRTYLTKDGETVYVLIRQMKALREAGLPPRPVITLGAVSERQAEAELALYLRDPVAYVRARAKPGETSQPAQEDSAVYLDEAAVAKFLAYLRKEGRTERYIRNVGFYLAAWAEDLAGKDLRDVQLQGLLKILSSYPRKSKDPDTGKEVIQKAARKHRITALKSFTAWLREVEAVLPQSQDPTLALKVPAARPEKARRAAIGGKKGYEIRDIERLYAAISPWRSKKFGWTAKDVPDVQSVRDVLLIHCKTGMHATEIERLARGEGKVRVVKDQGEIAATITFIHKSGRVHVQSIDMQTLAAVRRLVVRKAAPVDSYIRKVVKKAADSLDMDPIRFGELRHSFVTWARECGEEVRPKSGGLSLEAVAAAIGHQSIRTTVRHYDNTQVPPMVKIPIKLMHPQDPVPLGAAAPASESA
ncbi:hypothetical protein QEG98_23780 [Myxococcus sp. MxC21-1]|uniref:hypothetical protein n=1 Tax=Myxococcus sp. MxC21-1 TaxID=3041439 RepID=UPI00292E1499|nr:hypothetical protein [Myxococcus sp. MxC21-1]WNZ59119.1 hypothetical protein QEG98_23780 [Myxococcus sp. MxC21-1]